jgi:hypothetical protein
MKPYILQDQENQQKMRCESQLGYPFEAVTKCGNPAYGILANTALCKRHLNAVLREIKKVEKEVERAMNNA